MSKNTSASAFRKIDIDQYNEDNYKDEDQSEVTSPNIGPDEKEVSSLIAQNVDALNLVLKTAPCGTKNQIVKDNTLSVVMKVLSSIKSSEIEKAIESLDRDLIDVLMKYIYKGFESPVEGSSGHLLTWFEKVYSVGGLGCIVRVLTDRKRV